MKIQNYLSEVRIKNPHGVHSVKLLDSESAQIMHLLIKPGEQLKPHITPVDVSFYILEGNPLILIGKEKQKVKPDDLIHSPKDIVHCIYNDTQKQTRLLVIKTPKPNKPTKFIDDQLIKKEEL